jgi:hypothetical protein
MRSDYFSERKRWEDDMARRAQLEAACFDDIEHDIELQQSISPPDSPERAGHAVVERFEPELTVEEIDDSWITSPETFHADDMLDFTDEVRGEPTSPQNDAASTSSWEDDEEYESLFLEFISQQDDVLPGADIRDGDGSMDMSAG